MKREGRQHGLVQASLWSSTPNSRYVNKLNSPPTSGLFTKASPMPWNHSKFTGKCGRSKCTICHLQPAGKAKGTKKLRGCDIVTNYRLMTWRVTDTRPRLTFSGFSGTYMSGDEITQWQPQLVVDSVYSPFTVEVEELKMTDDERINDYL